tara:strand:+ start:168 stop:473 length:306 start_codon:yes stop_codon:yes gene_type:complete
MKDTIAYRCEESYFAENFSNIFYKEYKIVKETKEGFWIEIWKDKKRWISKTSRKKFAYTNKKEALEGFYFRKKRQVDILRSQLKRAESSLKKSKELLKQDQ